MNVNVEDDLNVARSGVHNQIADGRTSQAIDNDCAQAVLQAFSSMSKILKCFDRHAYSAPLTDVYVFNMQSIVYPK